MLIILICLSLMVSLTICIINYTKNNHHMSSLLFLINNFVQVIATITINYYNVQTAYYTTIKNTYYVNIFKCLICISVLLRCVIHKTVCIGKELVLLSYIGTT